MIFDDYQSESHQTTIFRDISTIFFIVKSGLFCSSIETVVTVYMIDMLVLIKH